MAHETHANETSAGILKDSLHDEGERHFREGIANADAGSYNARIRERQIKSIEDKGVAENAKKYVEAQGSAALKRVIAGTPELSRQVAQTVEFEKTAQQYETIVQKAAEAAYDNASQSNPVIREIRLRATAATTVPNMVRGTVVGMTTLFAVFKDSFSVINSGALVGVICFIIGLYCILTIPETHGRDLDFLEE